MSYRDLLAGFAGRRVLVVGDLMLDEYIHGRATRISPEAPVMVVRQQRTHAVPGGAANVAHNLSALGAEPIVVGVVGDDTAGRALVEALDAGGTRTVAVTDPARPTTRKTRILADQAHQILRIDDEDDRPIAGLTEDAVVAAVRSHRANVDAVILSDYLKGVLTPSVIHAAAETGVPVVANAKPKSLGLFQGLTLVQINRAEASGALGQEVTDTDAIDAAKQLRERIGCEILLVTLGASGMVAAHRDGRALRAPVPRVEVFDTAGAGDTVMATVALGVATAGFESEVFTLAGLTSAAVVRKVGVAVPSVEDLKEISER